MKKRPILKKAGTICTNKLATPDVLAMCCIILVFKLWIPKVYS